MNLLSFQFIIAMFLYACQSPILAPPEKVPLPLNFDEHVDGLGVENIDESDLEKPTGRSEYEPFNPKGIHVYFGSNQTFLSEKSKNSLAKIIKGMSSDPLCRIIIRSHTDSVGSIKRNLELSRQRSETIKIYLIQNGIQANRLKIDFAGEAETIGKNESSKDQSLSRRSEFILDYDLKNIE